MFTIFFAESTVTDFDTAKKSDTVLFAKYFQAMLRQGIYSAPSQFEAMFISASITDEIAARILEASDKALGEL